MTTHTTSSAALDHHRAASARRDPATRALLIAGAAAGPLFYLPAIVQMATRPGFDLRVHPISQLSTGELGWIQMTTFVLAGLGLVCLAIARRRVVTTGIGRGAVPVLIALGGLGFIVAGLFPQDAAYGFPVGAADGPAAETSWHAAVHMAAAIIAFTALAAAVVVALVRAIRGRRVAAAIGDGIVALVLLLPVMPEIASVQVAITGVFAFGWCTVVAGRRLCSLTRVLESEKKRS
ncbi:DUF998 domain-containing protein [Streptosporangium sp. NPDC049248]|uniref:DUF998 domain-containing protein n=1 Tax=Streptosporangium sp. NPDC049248 TaxID=3155651 RepID=UPI00341729D3